MKKVSKIKKYIIEKLGGVVDNHSEPDPTTNRVMKNSLEKVKQTITKQYLFSANNDSLLYTINKE
jgi:hypothetical protein